MELRWLEVVTGRRVVEGKWEPTYTPILQYRTNESAEWQDIPTVRKET